MGNGGITSTTGEWEASGPSHNDLSQGTIQFKNLYEHVIPSEALNHFQIKMSVTIAKVKFRLEAISDICLQMFIFLPVSLNI
jgi:hypothetical protein